MSVTKAEVLSKLLGRPVQAEDVETLERTLFTDDMVSEMYSPTRISNDGESCSYEIMLDKYVGSGEACATLKKIEQEAAAIKKRINPVIIEKMMAFTEMALDPKLNRSDGSASCSYKFNNVRIEGRNEEVCKPFTDAMALDNGKDAVLKTRFEKMKGIISKLLKKTGMADFFSSF